MKEEQNITIRIANQLPVAMTIKRDDEEIIRLAERNVNDLWRLWCDRFKDKTPVEVLAMVAFQFARKYYAGEMASAELASAVEDFEARLDDILLSMDTPHPAKEG